MLTDEKIKEIAHRHGMKYFSSADCAVHDACEAAIREALDLDGWVKVTPETMPDWIENWGTNSAVVDCYGFFGGSTRPDFLGPCHFNKSHATQWSHCYSTTPIVVTHWRELPAPPTKETKDV